MQVDQIDQSQKGFAERNLPGHNYLVTQVRSPLIQLQR